MADRDPPTVLLYTRDQCALCAEAEALLRGFQERYGYQLERVDVDADPALKAQYGDWVPVAKAGGEELFRLKADAGELEAALGRLARQE